MKPAMAARIRHRFRLVWVFCLLLGMGLGLVSVAQDTQRTAVVLDIEGPIGPAIGDYMIRGLDEARDQGAEVVVLRLDTPGGLDTSMREMIKKILASPVPVVTYVTPSGARAASAGTYLLYASHVAAMSPATNLGSATPVQMGGLPGSPEPADPPGKEESNEQGNEQSNEKKSTSENEEADSENATDEAGEKQKDSRDEPRRGETAMERKVMEDAVAYIRGLAERHGRNADWAEDAVREAFNVTATEALERNIIDVVANNLDELFEQIDGRTVIMDTGERQLQTSNLRVVEIKPDWRTSLLTTITNPTIAYFLMLIGFYGIIFELSSPGNIYPGVIGAICLVLALYAFQVLPINYAGLALIILGMLFMVGEAFMPSFGVLGFGGIIAFVVGSVILMDDANLQISLPAIGGTALVASGFMLWMITKLISIRGKQVVSGIEELIGVSAVALSDFDGEGRVQLHGENWQANSQVPVKKGQIVKVKAVKGLHVEVEPDKGKNPA